MRPTIDLHHNNRLIFGLLALIVGAYVALGVGYSVLLPLWETPDEPAHVEFIRYVQQHHALPTQRPDERGATPPSQPGNEFVQVPGYYVLVAAILHGIWVPPGAQWHRNPYVTWTGHPNRLALALHRADEAWPYTGLTLFTHLGRLLSVGFGLIALLATFGLVRVVTGRASFALVAAAWLGWSPGFVLSSSRVSNDAYVAAGSALTLLLCARFLVAKRPATFAALVTLSVALAGAVLGKLNAAFLLPLSASAVGVRAWVTEGPLSRASILRWLGQVLVVVVPALILVGVWWYVVGRWFAATVGTQGGFGVADVPLVLRSVSLAGLAGAVATLGETWWGVSQFESEIVWPPLVYVILGASTVALLGAGIASLLPRTAARLPDRNRLAALLLLLAAVPLFYATIGRALVPSIGYAAQARFVLPAAPCVALLVALGAGWLARWPLGRALTGFSLASVLATGVAAPFVLFPQINPPWIPARLARTPAEASGPPVASFANGVDLLSVTGVPRTLGSGDTLNLVLSWRVIRPPGQDFVASAQILGPDNLKVAGLDDTPFASAFPPRLWETGEIVEQPVSLVVPRALSPGLYGLRLAIYNRDEATPTRLPLAGTSADTVDLGDWSVLPTVGDQAAFAPVAAAFGSDLTLVGYTGRRNGAALTVSLLWRANRTVARRLVVSVQALGPAGQLVAQHDEEPVQGQLPTTVWPVGQLIRDDHLVTLPTESTPTRVIVVVYDRATQVRLPVSNGEASADFLALDRLDFQGK